MDPRNQDKSSKVSSDDSRKSTDLSRPPCPGPVSKYQWDSRNARWKRRSAENAAHKRDRYREYAGSLYMNDYELYLAIQLRSMMYRGYDLTFSDFEARNTNWYHWVEHHKAHETVFAAMVEATKRPAADQELIERTVAQNIVSNIPELAGAETVHIEIPSETHPSEKLTYVVEPVRVENKVKIQRVRFYSEQKAQQTMRQQLNAKKTQTIISECTGMCYGAEVLGVFKPLATKEEVSIQYNKHSKFCDVPSLVNELICDRDQEYARLLYIQALGMPCECLKYFQPRPSQRILCNIEHYPKPYRFSVNRHAVFARVREKIFQSYGINTDPTFWMRTLMILRGLTKDGLCTRGVIVSLEPGGKQVPANASSGS